MNFYAQKNIIIFFYNYFKNNEALIRFNQIQKKLLSFEDNKHFST